MDLHQQEMKNPSKVSFSNNDITNVNTCYGCARRGHLLKDCPLIQKMGARWRFKKKDNKGVIIAAWSDSETSDSESDEHISNIYLMAKEV